MPLTFDSVARKRTENDQAREALLQVVSDEKQQFKAVLDEFYAQSKRSSESYYQTNEAVINTIDRIMAAGDWEDSLFLNNTVKPLRELRAQALEIQKKLQSEEEVRQGKRRALEHNQTLLYVALYQAGDVSMDMWALALRNLPRSVQGRPVYAHEEQAAKAIRNKHNPVHLAYAIIAVDQTDVLESIKTVEDRIGLPLVQLKERAVKANNILELVYMGERYAFSKGQLQRI